MIEQSGPSLNWLPGGAGQHGADLAAGATEVLRKRLIPGRPVQLPRDWDKWYIHVREGRADE